MEITIETIQEALNEHNFELIKTRTQHANQTDFYQVKDKQGRIYPKSRNDKADIGEGAILDCYNRFGINGLKTILGVLEDEK